MNTKLVVAICVLAVMPAFGQAPPANAPKPTMADIQQVFQMISGDKTKMQIYCELSSLSQQMDKLDEKKDAKTLQTLGEKAGGLMDKLGSDYVKLLEEFGQVDDKSNEAREFGAALGSLDKQCK
jgi:hypothetical protein